MEKFIKMVVIRVNYKNTYSSTYAFYSNEDANEFTNSIRSDSNIRSISKYVSDVFVPDYDKDTL